MAQMIPERLPARASRGEERLFDILKKLPDDCLVYYEPIVRDRYPDFIVVMPTLGVLIIEVKGWYLGWIEDADNDCVKVREDGGPVRKDHPRQQARRYQYELMDEARRQQFARILLHPNGEREGNFLFPFGHLALLTNITRDQLDRSDKPSVRRAFSTRRDVTRDVLQEWEGLNGAELMEALQGRFDPFWPIDPLTDPQLNALRAVIHREIVITAPVQPGDSGTRDGVNLLKVLDLHQEREARNIRSGHRIIRGVAGSGKTVLLLARGKLLAEDGCKRVLLLCFNKALAAYLRSCATDIHNLIIKHFHDWGGSNGINYVNNEDNDDYGKRLLSRLERGEGDAGAFDAVLIDEYQDFSLSWFKCAKLALKEPEDGDLLVVGDASQGLYKLRGFRWSDTGIHWRGRVSRLEVNYRNTREMMIAAESFASGGVDDEEDPCANVPPSVQTCRRRGPEVEVIQCANLSDEINKAVERIDHWIAAGVYRPHEIGILFPRRDTAAHRDALRQLQTQLNHHGVVLISGNRADGTYANPGVKISTIYGSKGLQFPAVIFIWADLLPSSFENRIEAMERGLMYVALTRAEQQLLVMHSGPSKYVNELRGNLGLPEAEAVLGQPWLPSMRDGEENPIPF
jgi:hypothetical protein